jgi:calcineurin-like phosphoesterase family protein
MDDQIYIKARTLLVANPELGKKKLADLLGVHAPMGRRLKERYKGEIEGHRTDPEYQRFLVVKTQNPTWGYQRIAAALQMPVERAKLCLARYAGATVVQSSSTPVPPAPETPVEGSSFQESAHGGQRDLTYRGTRITTLDDFLVFAQVDTTVWEVERHVLNKWEVGTKGPGGDIVTAPLFQIKVWLRRKQLEGTIKDLMKGLFEQLKCEAPVVPAIVRPSGNRGMLEMSLMDLHLGKIAWAPETGRHYDVETAERMFWAALEDLVDKASGCKPEKILFVAGNDFFNTDNGRTTTAGTPQDEGMVWKQSFIRGRDLLVKAIERLRKIAPVQVVCVNGNHDATRLFYVAEVLQAWFGRTADVMVDNTPTQRKYVHYANNLIGFTHGNNERHQNLPLLMASEKPQEWAKSKHREWHLGHWHIKRHKMFLPAEDQQGVLVRIVPSLCPSDAWHSSMGYGGKLAAEAYYWDPSAGCVATFTHSPA